MKAWLKKFLGALMLGGVWDRYVGRAKFLLIQFLGALMLGGVWDMPGIAEAQVVGF